jgi:hypothetical protein
MSNWREADLKARSVTTYGLAEEPAVALPKAKGRVEPPKEMNKTERSFSFHLAAQERAGEILYWDYESITLKLAADCRLTMDFFVVAANMEITLYDVKGRRKFKRDDGSFYFGPLVTDDAAVKLKVAADKYPFLTFMMVWPSESGGWDFREISC